MQTSNLSAASADVPVTIACDDVPSGTVSVSLTGTVSDFNADAIQSNVAGLGITVKTEQGHVITPNKFYNVSEDLGLTSKTGSLTLKAGIISDGKTVLPGGEFNASATLVLTVS
ncbi:fimbrial protein [Pantoea sp. Nvir]|uniref:fimbrial protein n=1 Tax=Pantoea sp. Nvir TaxID=2576760 RepID=UPI0030CDB224